MDFRESWIRAKISIPPVRCNTLQLLKLACELGVKLLHRLLERARSLVSDEAGAHQIILLIVFFLLGHRRMPVAQMVADAPGIGGIGQGHRKLR